MIYVLHNDGSASFTQVQWITLPHPACILDVELGDLEGWRYGCLLVNYATSIRPGSVQQWRWHFSLDDQILRAITTFTAS
jgi:hypothetical protein